MLKLPLALRLLASLPLLGWSEVPKLWQFVTLEWPVVILATTHLAYSRAELSEESKQTAPSSGYTAASACGAIKSQPVKENQEFLVIQQLRHILQVCDTKMKKHVPKPSFVKSESGSKCGA